jgi:hypothetical protein
VRRAHFVSQGRVQKVPNHPSLCQR